MGLRAGSVAVLAVLGISCLTSCGGRQRASGPTALTRQAEELVSLLAKGDFQQVTDRFDQAMKGAAPPQKLGEAWTGLTQQLGAFERQTGTRTTREMDYEAVYVHCQFERGRADVKVVFDGNGKVAGLWFVPPS